MGRVYEAHQASPARTVAVKVLRAGLVDYAAAEEALTREATTLALAGDDFNEFVVRCYGAARGVATPAWEAAMGALKPQLERHAPPPPLSGAPRCPPPPSALSPSSLPSPCSALDSEAP